MTDQAGVGEPQTAMLLTQTEWDDLADLLRTWNEWNEHNRTPMARRQRALAERIIEANQP